MRVPVEVDGVLGLYSAVGDAFAGRKLGFGRRRAALAARFAQHRETGDDAVAASWVAGALAETGLVAIVMPTGAAAAAGLHASADAPLHGAHLIEATPGLPPRAADIVRWYREHDDGTGIPDRLRWDGIPPDAAALGIVHAFLEAVDDPAEPREPLEALFAVSAESGRRFRVELVRSFRTFVGATADWDAAFIPPLPPLDEADALTALAARIDARDPDTAGRSERLAASASVLAERLGLDALRAGRLARLLALGRAAAAVAHDDFDPFSRIAREHRSALALRAAAIAGSVATYAPDAPVLASSSAWFEDGPQDRLAAVLALVVAADPLRPPDAARRLTAAAGTQLDPDVTSAYLAGLGAAQ
jgi:hypothetical protein